MSEYEASVLEYYQLSTAFPTEWPSEKNSSDQSEDENDHNLHNCAIPKIKPRYSALVKASGSHNSYIKSSQKAEGIIENLPQHDEPDPLGTTDSVVTRLKSMGLPVEDDIELREW